MKQVLAKTYLPTMEECNRRVIHRWRMYVPTLSWFQQERRLAKLNGFIKGILRDRWIKYEPGTKHRDLLDRMIGYLKVRSRVWEVGV